MKFNQILPVIAIYVVALGGCSNTLLIIQNFIRTLKQ